MIKFEEHDGLIFKMLDKPVPLTPETEMPCLVRLIQDDSPMGKHNKDLPIFDPERLTPKICTEVVDVNDLSDPNRGRVRCDGFMSIQYYRYELIGTLVKEGSNEWALYQMMQGEKVYHPTLSVSSWIAAASSTGWQLYKEPKPEPDKETEIVAHKQHATCLVCGKEIKGLLDRHATVSIKRYSISSLYESTYSHYCGKCFLKLGFDATERELRNRQQPIVAKPEPAKEQFEVGDWVEMDYKGTLYHRQVISVHDNGIRVEFGGATPLISFDGKSSMLLIRLVRKLKPNEVEVPITISGTVRKAYNEDGTIDDEQFQLLPNGIWDGTEMFISFDALDSHTRKLVESLLKAQEEEPETKDDETTTFPAGKYYIGDPCYVFSCESWSKFCDKTDCFENGEDHPHLFSHRGHKFFGASTAHGDGTFYDSDGYRYGVDAGMLGIVPLALVELEGESIEDIEKHKLGRIHEFKEDFEVGVNELHTFLFGDIIIDTDDGGDI